MKILICFILASASLPALAAKSFPEERTYVHHLFRTQQVCKDAQNGHMWMNCNQTIQLRPDGTASVMLTDIMNIATYEITGKNLVIKSTQPGDMAEKMEFTVDSTERNLVSKGSSPQIWELEQPCE